MFVTDPVEPLSDQLNQNPDKNLVLWGLYKVAVSGTPLPCMIYLLSIILECYQVP